MRAAPLVPILVVALVVTASATESLLVDAATLGAQHSEIVQRCGEVNVISSDQALLPGYGALGEGNRSGRGRLAVSDQRLDQEVQGTCRLQCFTTL